MGWARNEQVIAGTFERIVHATPEDYVLVLSQPRTGSKFLTATLRGSWGARSGYLPKANGHGHVAHAHGLSEKRLSSVGPKKAARGHYIRERIGVAGTVTVFTIYRSFQERFVSHVALQKFPFAEAPEERLVKIVKNALAQEREAETNWIAENLGAFFGAPPVSSLTDFLCFVNANTTCIMLRIEHMNELLQRYLYPMVSADEAAARRAAWGGPPEITANSSEERGVAEFKARIATMVRSLA